MSQSQRRGFTVVELMMVIIIIALLSALLTNAVQSSREMGRRTQCMNKMRQAGMAAIDFESRNSGYPGWNHLVFGPPPQQTRYTNSWIYQILPGLGRSDVTEKSPPAWDPMSPSPMTRIALNELLVCPSDAEKMLLQTPQSPTSLVCSAGRQDTPQATATWPADWRSNAVFVNRNDRDSNGAPVKVEVTDASFIAKGDGLAVTLLLSENIDARTWYNVNADETVNCLVFWPPDNQGNPPKDVHRINGPKDNSSTSYDVARPSSYHPGGVNMFFCSGQGRFVSANMDYRIYCAIMTPRSASAMDPGTTTLTPTVNNVPKVTEDDSNSMTPQTTLRPQLLEMLRCPENRTRLRLADAQLVTRLNEAVSVGILRNVGGSPVSETLDGGLVREDGRIVYPIVEGIPHLLVDEGIPLEPGDAT